MKYLILILLLAACGQSGPGTGTAKVKTIYDRVYVAGDAIAYKADFGNSIASKASASLVNLAKDYSPGNAESSILAHAHVQALATQTFKSTDVIVASFGILEIKMFNTPSGCGVGCGDKSIDYQNVAGGESVFRNAVQTWMNEVVKLDSTVLIAEIPYGDHPNSVTDRYRAIVADVVSKTGAGKVSVVKNPRQADVEANGFPTEAERLRIAQDISEAL